MYKNFTYLHEYGTIIILFEPFFNDYKTENISHYVPVMVAKATRTS